MNTKTTRKSQKKVSHQDGPSRTSIASSDGCNLGFWTQWIKPKEAALLSQTLGPVYFVVKNHGPNTLMLRAQQGDPMDLPAGAVRATYAHDTITVENPGEKPALIEFEFLPILLKH